MDLIVGDLDLAIELKSVKQADERHTKGLRALMQDQQVKRALVVSLDAVPRRLAGGITVLPWQVFCRPSIPDAHPRASSRYVCSTLPSTSWKRKVIAGTPLSFSTATVRKPPPER